MLTYEYKIHGSKAQYAAIEEAIRVVQFIRNKCLRLWMDTRGMNKNDLQCACAQLAREYSFARRLNSQARQAAADRAWAAIGRFYDNCKAHKPGKKGYPQFQHNNRSVEYKQTGWKLADDGRHITFTDGCGIGRLRLVGNKKQQIEAFPVQQIKRVRIIRRADGYFVQVCVQSQRQVVHQPTDKQIGIDVGLKAFYTDSEGAEVSNPRFLRKSEKKLKRLHRRVSKKQKKSKNRKKARRKLAKAYLKVSRQREDFARKQANALISSSDLIAYEDLQIANLVKNHRLAKSISDAAWGRFLWWVNYYGDMHGVPVLAVAPHFTTQDCSGCGKRVYKSLSVRTHVCPHCGLVLDRDHNAAKNILAKALEGTVGHTGTSAPRGAGNAWGQGTATVCSARTSSKSPGRTKNPPCFSRGSVSFAKQRR